MRLLVSFALAATVSLPAALHAQKEPQGKETTIDFAAGGIINFQPEGRDSNIVYLQDRRLRWYKVTLTGPCLPDATQNTIVYRPSPGNRLDRFSSISSTRYPQLNCGITSITTSAPPPGQPGSAKRHRR
ncbi:hypothetical protein [Sphingomonas aracearum]|uniref:hypothetical protein n=1 Tax=Sphingomonas aracearum TaxID=2283317 RepID=UPI0011C0392D|nr:hypothetical protein [Sphingomonas aracearum]